MVFLVVVADMHVGPQADHAVVRGNDLIEDAQDRGFARSVVSDQRDVLTAADLKGNTGKEVLTAIGLGQILHTEYFPAALDAGREDEVHIILNIDWLFEDFRLLEHLLAALCAPDRFLAVKAAQLFDDLLLVADLRLIVEIGVVLLFAQCLFALRIDGIVALKEHGLSVFQLQDLGDRAVKEIAVVGDHEHSAPVVHEVGFQPPDAVHIQVIGGLVEHDQIGLLHQELSERDPRLLSTGERRDALLIFFRRKAKSLEDAGHLALVGVAVFPLKFVQEVRIGGDGLCERFAF